MGLGLRKTYAEIRAVPAIVLDRVMAARLPPTEVYVINGFWRGRTTWLQQNLARAIGAKSIFEPFEQRFVEYRERAYAFHPFRVGLYEGAFLPYLDRPEKMEKIRPFLDTIFRGHAGHSFGLKARDSWRDSFRRKLVVKFVRASLSLEGILSVYSCPVIHIRRHPCGVEESCRAIRDEWGRSFDELRIKKSSCTNRRTIMRIYSGSTETSYRGAMRQGRPLASRHTGRLANATLKRSSPKSPAR